MKTRQFVAIRQFNGIRHFAGRRLLCIIIALLALSAFISSAAAGYVVMPNAVSGFVELFNAKSAALGLRYANMRYTHISFSKKTAAFALRGPEGLDYAFSDTMELSIQGEHDNQRVTSVTLTAKPLAKELGATAAYRQEFTMASLLALESLVTGATRYEAARVLAALNMPYDHSVLSSALDIGYGSPFATGYPYSSYPYSGGYPYAYPSTLTDKGASVSETLNNYPITLTAELESGEYTMTAKLAGIYPYPTSALYPGSSLYQNPWSGWQTAADVITLTPGVTANVRVGQKVLIRLEYTEGDGYDWEYVSDGAALTQISDEKHTTLVQQNITKGVREWLFEASEYGSSTLSFAYVDNSAERMAQGMRFFIDAY